MPITAADIKFFLSGGAANSDPNAALGGAKSSTEVGTALHNLFDQVSGDESNSGDTEYRCIYIQNDHGTLTLQNAVLWISVETGSADTSLDLALGGEGLNGTAETVADESTAPVGETFSHPTTKASGLSLGNLAPGDFYPVWVKRNITASATAVNDDTGTLKVEGETAA